MIITLLLFWAFRRRRNKKLAKADEDDDGLILDVSKGPLKFSYAALAKATNGFDEKQKLGEGGFGGVYRGVLSRLNMDVAVKRVSKRSKQGMEEFASEVNIISRLRHRNLVKLIGWCHQQKELLIVYEFMPNGSLDSYLFRNQSSLTWNLRYKIALDLAFAIRYLHEEWDQCVVHRDIKSSNIILDSNFNAKLGDFGLATLVEHEKESEEIKSVAGTLGYMAPECIITGNASKESDVYSFGIVLLEIVCGRKAIDMMADPSEQILVNWVRELHGKEKHLEAIDPTQKGLYLDEKQIECLMIVGLWCAHPNYKLRPSIWEAILVLKFDAPLPPRPFKCLHSPVDHGYDDSLLKSCGNVSGSSVSGSYASITSLTFPR